MPIALKFLLTAAVVVAVSEVAKRSDKLGAVLAAMPLVTILAMTWMQIEDLGAQKIANHARYTFWYVLPTLPMFLAVPVLLERGWSYWSALTAYMVVTALLVLLTAAIGKRFGVQLLP